ncbi:CvpA family protein [Bacillus sp. FJAT-44742]|uniref:CvpA family protein n=1 Tax=Bacillus sp. FJAT-44742 TaxID=2014005 RepID=UPI000C248F44|nr:CvpA family protein [Bacillus sp. FJAT-44742]
MLSLLIILFLFMSFLIGLRRGFVLQLVHLVSIFISFFVAYIFYRDVAEFLRLWLPYPHFSTDNGTVAMLISSFDFESVYYAGISFVLLFFITKILLQIIGSMLDFVSHIPILRTFNRWLGGVLGLLETYLIIFILLIAAALLPVDFIQESIANSSMARLMVENTPILSDWLQNLWSQGI